MKKQDRGPAARVVPEAPCPKCSEFYPRWVTIQDRWDKLFDEREDEIVHLRRVLWDIAGLANGCATKIDHDCTHACMDAIAHLAGSAVAFSRKTLTLLEQTTPEATAGSASASAGPAADSEKEGAP